MAFPTQQASAEPQVVILNLTYADTSVQIGFQKIFTNSLGFKIDLFSLNTDSWNFSIELNYEILNNGTFDASQVLWNELELCLTL